MRVLSNTEQLLLIKLVPEFEKFIPELNQIFQKYIKAKVEREGTPAPANLKKKLDEICKTVDAFNFLSEKLKLQIQTLNGWVAPDVKRAELDHGYPLRDAINSAQLHALEFALEVKKSDPATWLQRKDQILKPEKDLVEELINIYVSATGKKPGRINQMTHALPGVETEKSVIADVINFFVDDLEMKSCKGLIKEAFYARNSIKSVNG